MCWESSTIRTNLRSCRAFDNAVSSSASPFDASCPDAGSSAKVPEVRRLRLRHRSNVCASSGVARAVTHNHRTSSERCLSSQTASCVVLPYPCSPLTTVTGAHSLNRRSRCGRGSRQSAMRGSRASDAEPAACNLHASPERRREAREFSGRRSRDREGSGFDVTEPRELSSCEAVQVQRRPYHAIYEIGTTPNVSMPRTNNANSGALFLCCVCCVTARDSVTTWKRVNAGVTSPAFSIPDPRCPVSQSGSNHRTSMQRLRDPAP